MSSATSLSSTTISVSALISNTIRPEIIAQSPYFVPDASGMIKLDAMENPYGLPESLKQAFGQHLARVALNRYPVPTYRLLKQKICAQFGVPAGYDVVLGNGSDELISMLSVACARPGAVALAPLPGFVMYAGSAQLAGMRFVGVDLDQDLGLDLDAMLDAIATHRPALVYLAYPNNPTGSWFKEEHIVRIIHAVGDSGIVVVDEAYQPFAPGSMMLRLPEFGNLIVMRTVSKQGMAGLRLGYMSGAPALLEQLEKVRPPYNINVLTAAAAELLLDHIAVFDEQAAQICQQRAVLSQSLQQLPGVQVFPSEANFLLIRVPQSEQIFNKLREQQILVKNVGKMHTLLVNCLRVTVSTPEENHAFLTALSRILGTLTQGEETNNQAS